MKDFTFDKLPEAIHELFNKVSNIETLLLNNRNTISDKPKLLTVAQAAQFITLSVPTIYRLVREMKIPCSKRGKRLYFLETELIDWIKVGRKLTTEKLINDAHNNLLPRRGDRS